MNIFFFFFPFPFFQTNIALPFLWSFFLCVWKISWIVLFLLSQLFFRSHCKCVLWNWWREWDNGYSSLWQRSCMWKQWVCFYGFSSFSSFFFLLSSFFFLLSLSLFYFEANLKFSLINHSSDVKLICDTNIVDPNENITIVSRSDCETKIEWRNIAGCRVCDLESEDYLEQNSKCENGKQVNF